MRDLEDKECVERDPEIEMVCTYSNPKVKPKWFKNKMEIFHGNKYQFLSDSGEHTLVIKRIAKEDAGRYMCTCDDKQTLGSLEVKRTFLSFLHYLYLMHETL